MKYYNFRTIESDELYLVSSERELKEKDVAVIINCEFQPVTAVVEKEIDEYTALVSGNEIESVFTFLDMLEIKMKKDSKIKKAQIECIMKDKIDEIKMIETLEKYAGRNQEFSILLAKYKELVGAK